MSDARTTRLSDSDYPREGDIIDERYQIKRVIGRGGMSCIVCAHQLALERDVAIKLLHPHVATEAQTIARFKREVHLAKGLTHPNIIQYFDYGTLPSGSMYLVMELLEGCDLHTMIRRERNLGLHRAIDITLQILDGLAEAHAKSVVHRDLKPRNIFMLDLKRRADYVKILDFGIAKSTQAEESELTRTGVVCGTPSYLAPELLITQHASPASDLYAVGLIFLEMLTGRRAFKADTMARTFFMQLRHPVPIPSTFLGTPVERFLLKSLAKHPDDRFQSAQQMMDDLEALRAQMPRDVRLTPDDVDSLTDSQAALAPGMSELDNMGLEILRDPAWVVTPTPAPGRPDPLDDMPTTLAELRTAQPLAPNPAGRVRVQPSPNQRARAARTAHTPDPRPPSQTAPPAAAAPRAPVAPVSPPPASPHPAQHPATTLRTSAALDGPPEPGRAPWRRRLMLMGLVGALLAALGVTVMANLNDDDTGHIALPYGAPAHHLPADPPQAVDAPQNADFAFVDQLGEPSAAAAPAPAQDAPPADTPLPSRANDPPPSPAPNKPPASLASTPGAAQAPARTELRKSAPRATPPSATTSQTGTQVSSGTKSPARPPATAPPAPTTTPTPDKKPGGKSKTNSVEEFMKKNTILGDDDGLF